VSWVVRRLCRRPWEPGDPAAWAYAVVDVVLPDMYRRVAELPADEGVEFRRRIVDAARTVIQRAAPNAAGGERRALHRVATSVSDLAGDDVGLVLRLSEAVVGAAINDEASATSLIEDHWRRSPRSRRRARRQNDLLVAWMRFVPQEFPARECVRLKHLNLTELVEQNYRAHCTSTR
jgi:hypothetical protein